MKRIFPLLGSAVWLSCSPLLADGLALEPDDSRGVKLSDAMESAAKGDKRDLGERDSSNSDDDNDCDDESGADAWLGFTSPYGVSYEKGEYFCQVPIDVRYSTPFSGDIRGLTHITLTPLSIESEKAFLGLYGGIALVDLEPDSLPDRGTDDLFMFECGVTFRYYLNGSHTAFSPYLTGGLGFQWLDWDYRNPVVVDGETIGHDRLGGMEGYVGFGVSTKRNSWVSIFAEAHVGGTGFYGTTDEGFDNDVFDSFGFFAVKVGLTVKF